MTDTFAQPLPNDIQELAAQVMQIACDRSALISVAESCTGGLLAAVLTDVEGCAHAFERGLVAYTDDAKVQLLNVPAELIESHGAVSDPVAREMALGALRGSKATVTLSITGFAGPGGPGEEPGLVYFGCATDRPSVRVVVRHFGSATRAEVRRQCLRTGLELLREALGA